MPSGITLRDAPGSRICFSMRLYSAYKALCDKYQPSYSCTSFMQALLQPLDLVEAS